MSILNKMATSVALVAGMTLCMLALRADGVGERTQLAKLRGMDADSIQASINCAQLLPGGTPVTNWDCSIANAATCTQCTVETAPVWGSLPGNQNGRVQKKTDDKKPFPVCGKVNTYNCIANPNGAGRICDRRVAVIATDNPCPGVQYYLSPQAE